MRTTLAWKSISNTWCMEADAFKVECHPLTGLRLLKPFTLSAILGVEIVDAIELGSKPLAETGSQLEIIDRGDVLFTRFAPTQARPVECHARWRAHGEGVFDLEISTLTPGKWDGLAVQTRSSLPSGEMKMLEKYHPPFFLFRPANSSMTYAEFCHPHDGIKLSSSPNKEGGTDTRYHLFGHDLEKGVILRGRLRGILLPRQDDEKLAESAYHEFIASPPNLTL